MSTACSLWDGSNFRVARNYCEKTAPQPLIVRTVGSCTRLLRTNYVGVKNGRSFALVIVSADYLKGNISYEAQYHSTRKHVGCVNI